MISRIVKMTFRADKVDDFLAHFETVQDKISAFPGCTSVRLYRDISDSCVLYTHSLWDSENDLENYRSSDLFRSTWSVVKLMFAVKAEAISMKPVF